MEGMMTEPEFESFADVDDFVAARTGELMDINFEMMQFSREGVRQTQAYVRRFTAVAEDIFEAHAIGAKMVSDLMGDMIMDEYGIEKTEVIDMDTEDEDESE